MFQACMADPEGVKEELCTRLHRDITEEMLLYRSQGNTGSYTISETVFLLI